MSQDGLVFNKLSDTVLEVRDTISNQQYRIESPEPMEIEPTEYDDFPGPVTKSIRIDTTVLSLPEFYSATIRDKRGNMEGRLGLDGGCYIGNGVTFVEFHTPVKSYLRIDGHFEYNYSLEGVSIELSEDVDVILGSRVWECYPDNTIIVSDSLEDLREAVSHFGDAILTTSPERSFPTLRGHPPQIKLGSSLEIPESISKPDTGITITVPPTKSALLSVAPLAFYLLATVEIGEEFSIKTSSGYTHQPRESTTSAAVRSVLTRCFYLDCIVRTEGLYPVDLRERNEFEEVADVDLDYKDLYEKPLTKRVERYLQIDPQVIFDITAEWPVTAVVGSGKKSIEALPYLAYELVHLRPENPPRYSGDEARRRVIKSFTQMDKKSRSASLVFDGKGEFIDVPETKSRQTIWVGEGIPLNASKFLLEGYVNNKIIADESTVKENQGEDYSSSLDVCVICNENRMSQELDNIRESINPRNDFPIELSMYSQVNTGELQQIFQEGTDYLHFVGHATPKGLECPDGILNVATVNESNVTTFFLNACQSFRQGKRLVERGSSGGIVSYGDISDKYATSMSSHIVQLLTEGFPIGVCLDIIQDTTPIGRQYTVVGSHGARVIQPDGGPPYITKILKDGESYKVNITTYGAGLVQYAIGTGVNHAFEAADASSVVPSSITVETNCDELKEVVPLRESPVIYNGELQSVDEFIALISKQHSSSG
jgi:hypothetical protein